jgi:hypothetical protein
VSGPEPRRMSCPVAAMAGVAVIASAEVAAAAATTHRVMIRMRILLIVDGC